MNSTTRRNVLLVLGAGVLAVLLADWTGAFSGWGATNSADDGGFDARSQYLDRQSLAAKHEALAQQADEWRAAAELAKERWAFAKQEIIVERTAELAEARFRDSAIDALKDLNLAAVRASAIQDRGAPQPAAGGAGQAGAVVRTIALEVKFDATGQREVYAAIDRLENIAGVRTNIASLRVDGPGRTQLSQTITTTLTLQALAAVGVGKVGGEVE